MTTARGVTEGRGVPVAAEEGGVSVLGTGVSVNAGNAVGAGVADGAAFVGTEVKVDALLHATTNNNETATASPDTKLRNLMYRC